MQVFMLYAKSHVASSDPLQMMPDFTVLFNVTMVANCQVVLHATSWKTFVRLACHYQWIAICTA